MHQNSVRVPTTNARNVTKLFVPHNRLNWQNGCWCIRHNFNSNNSMQKWTSGMLDNSSWYTSVLQAEGSKEKLKELGGSKGSGSAESKRTAGGKHDKHMELIGPPKAMSAATKQKPSQSPRYYVLSEFNKWWPISSRWAWKCNISWLLLDYCEIRTMIKGMKCPQLLLNMPK